MHHVQVNQVSCFHFLLERVQKEPLERVQKELLERVQKEPLERELEPSCQVALERNPKVLS